MIEKKSQHQENQNEFSSIVVRQSRFESEGLFYIRVGKEKTKLINYSLFGLGFISSIPFEIDKYLEDVKIEFAENVVSESSYVVKRCKKIDFGYEIGLEVVNNSVPVETIKRIKDFNTVVSALDEKQNKFKALPDAYKHVVINLATRLEQYQNYTEAFSQKEFAKSTDYLEAREALVEVVSNQIKAELYETTDKLKGFATEIPEKDLKCAFDYFREYLGKYLFQSSFTKRSFEKPRGYAGDFEMMNQIYANDGFAKTVFGNCMEKVVQSYGEPSAVRNRVEYLGNKIISKVKSSNKNLIFLSVACGPAEELKRIISRIDQKDLDRVEFHLLDQDEGALQYAQKNAREAAITQGKKVNIRLINKSIKELLIEGLKQNYDMIYSAGLFDYFADPVANKAGKKLFSLLAPEGDLIIGNFNIVTTNWFGMLALFDWSLILRGEDDLKRVFGFASDKMKIESENKNINLFCCIKNG